MSAAISTSLPCRRKYIVPFWIVVFVDDLLILVGQTKSHCAVWKLAAAWSMELSTASRFCACSMAARHNNKQPTRAIVAFFMMFLLKNETGISRVEVASAIAIRMPRLSDVPQTL